jgi:hypothetical protein
MKVLGVAIGQTKDQLALLTDEEKKTTDEGIALTTTLKAQQKEYNSLSTVVTNQKSAVNELGKATKANTDLMDLESNSIATNRKLYNALYGEIVNTTAATDAERKALDKKIETAKKVNDRLKEQEKALGDTRRNVGNYAESLQSVIGGLTSAIPATKGFGAAQQGVNMVLSANPIGGVITLLFALKEIFSSNAMVADQLTFALDGINKAFQFVIDVIVDTVTNFDKLTTAISNPFAFFGKLGKGALQAGKDGFEASKQLDELTGSIGASTVAIEKNGLAIEKNTTILRNTKMDIDARKKAAQEIIRLENENTEKRVANATAEFNAEKLKLKNKQLSGEEVQRLGLLEAKIEKARADGVGSIRKAEIENYKILYGEQEELAKKNAELLKQQREKEAQELKQYNAQILSLQDEFQKSERERLEDSFVKKASLIKGTNEEEKKLIKDINDAKIKALEKFDEDDRKRIKDAEDKKTQDQIARDAETFNKQVALNEKLLQNDLDLVDLSEATEKEKAKRKLDIQITFLEKQLALTRAFFGADGVITEEEKAGIKAIENALAKLRKEASTPTDKTVAEALGIDPDEMQKALGSLNALQGIFSNFASIVDSVYDRQIQDIDDKKEAEIRAVEESGASEESKQKKIEALNKKYAMEKYNREKEAFFVSKAIQLVQATIATAVAVIQGLQAGLSLGPAGIALGPALAAAAGLAGAVQIGLIASQKPPPPPKFAKGVIGLRGPGTSTSDNIDAKLSRGESVMTAKATEAFSDQLAMMELAVGNKPNYQFGKGRFATGFIPTTDGGFSARQTAQSSLNSVAMAETVISAVRSIPPPVLEYSEFTRFTNGVNKSVQVSEL